MDKKKTLGLMPVVFFRRSFARFAMEISFHRMRFKHYSSNLEFRKSGCPFLVAPFQYPEASLLLPMSGR